MPINNHFLPPFQFFFLFFSFFFFFFSDHNSETMDPATDRLQPNISYGNDFQGPIFCEPFGLKVVSSGYFAGENPVHFTLPILMLQLGIITLFSAALHLLLKPLGQPKYVSDLLGGFLLGPSIFSHDSNFHQLLFSDKNLMVLDVYEQVGIALFSFLIGLRTDFEVVRRSGGLAVSIGVMSFFLPFLINGCMSTYLTSRSKLDPDMHKSLALVGFLESMINYHVIYTMLVEIKLVNSELGRVALSASTISTFVTWLIMICIRTARDAKMGLGVESLAAPLCRIFSFIVIIKIIRPVMFWMIRKTPEGKNLKEAYVCAMTLIIFLMALYSDVTGTQHVFTMLVFGMAVPKGPPLASGLEDKLELFVSTVLLPSFIINLGRKINVFSIKAHTFKDVELLIVLAFLGKMAGCMLPSIYWDMPVKDAFFLGLLTSSQGILDIQFFNHFVTLELLSEEILSIMVIMAVVHAIIVNPLLRFLYDPKVRYLGYKRRTIQESLRNVEFRILACVHQEENIPTLISILEASNPTRDSPISLYILDLVELVGRAMPLFITHQLSRTPSSKSSRTNRIISAFSQYEIRNQGLVTVQCFTSIAPYASIHEDICTLALEKRTSLVIIMYNKSDPYSIRAMNRNVLDKSPCSVGVLVHKGILRDTRSAAVQSWFSFHVCVIFIGGPDDREAVAYSSRMVEHPNISLTVIRFIAINYNEPDLIERKLDTTILNQLRANSMGTGRFTYTEESVSEGYGTTRALRSLEDADYDLILVGRRHDSGNPVMLGLLEWSEIQELGIIGDILTSSDFKCKASVMVVQQHDSVIDNMQQHGTIVMPMEVVGEYERSQHSQGSSSQPRFYHQVM